MFLWCICHGSIVFSYLHELLAAALRYRSTNP
jgi:hypothetical protein